MYGAIQFALFPVKPSRAAHFTVIESPRMLLTPEKKYMRKEKSPNVYRVSSFLPMK